MKRFTALSLFVLFFVGCARETGYTQPASGCDLTSWMLPMPAHSQRTPEIFPPQLRDTTITVNGSSHKISLPQGFTMSVFAAVPTARGLALSGDGVIYATSYNGNIYALPDHDHNGKADSSIVVASGLGDPHGIGFYHDELYVSNNSAVFHLIDANHDRKTESKQQLFALSGGGGHTSRNFVIDTVKQKFYVQIGSTSNMGPDTDDSLRATVVEANIDGSNRRVFSRGLRNAVGMDIDPRTGALWVNNNGMDNLFDAGNPKSNNNPSESIYILCDGANFGWPWAYGFRMRNPQAGFVDKDTNFIASLSGPVAEVLAHEAPLGLHFYRGAVFPSTYHNAIFQCYHGSWNRTPPAPPRITVMWADPDGQHATVTDFVNGFQPDSSGSRWGRPVSIIEGADSAFYVSDDQANVVYRIKWTGPTQTNLFVDSRDLTSKTFTLNQVVPIHWLGNNVDSVDVYFSSSAANWTRIGGTRHSPFIYTATEAGTTADQIKLVDARSGIESISNGTFAINSLGADPSIQHSGFSLDLLSPNPARESESVTYTVASRVQVRAELFNTLGNLVRTLIDQDVDPGKHQITFDVSELAQGSYTVRVVAGDEIRSQQLVITR